MTRAEWIKPVIWWAWAAVPITLLSLLIYTAAQQGYRQAANDPQVQMAQAASQALAGGASPQDVVPSPRVELGHSLSPFVVVYDSTGEPVAGNGYINDSWPKPPQGVFDNAAWWAHGHTWETAQGYRFSIAVVPYPLQGASGYVLVGRSMALAEERILNIGKTVALGWAVTLAATLVASLIARLLLKAIK